MIKKRCVIRFLAVCIWLGLMASSMETFSQTGIDGPDTAAVKAIYDYELSQGRVFLNLFELCTKIGGRLSGSPQAQKAVLWAQRLMRSNGFDTVYRQPVMVPHWVRGPRETAWYSSRRKVHPLAICALGGSIATPQSGLEASVIEVKGISQLSKLDPATVKGKIVFFNGAFDQRLFDPGDAYDLASDQRRNGAAAAARQGAIGVLVRSLNSALDNYPHTGSMDYVAGIHKIPACAISTLAAQELAVALEKNPRLTLHFKIGCKTLPDVRSYNVVAELKGDEKPREVILVGGHLDSWDLAQGAHDDGAGVMQALEVLEIFKACHYKPKHTLRVVFFMNEENGTRGAMEYARLAGLSGEICIAAMESDEGGFTPRGFTIEASDQVLGKMLNWRELFRRYGADWFVHGGDMGSDVELLKGQTNVLINYLPDSQRYYSIHHSAKDVIGSVNERELKLGAAAMASLVYLIDKYGINE